MKNGISEDRIRSLAGEKTFWRGKAYLNEGTVKDLVLSSDGGSACATVTGSSAYSVRLSMNSAEFGHVCSCPIGSRGILCKHAVAVALAWILVEGAKASDAEAVQTSKRPEEGRNEDGQTPGALGPSGSGGAARESTGSEAGVDGSTFQALHAGADEAVGVVLEQIPARMLNEFVYCPRLFYYEHVEGIFLHNADTIEGKHQHKRVDRRKSGKLPPPDGKERKPDESSGADSGDGDDSCDGVDETIHSRSVELGSDTLGVTAKLDLVEGTVGADGTVHVQPVEYKHGEPARDANGAPSIWAADKMQLGLQVLLLRENGYACDSGVVFYCATRQRVTIVITATDAEWIRDRIAAARRCMAGTLPPPLEDSPKCPRCSLVPVCLPDEARLLSMLAHEDGEEREPAPEQQAFDFMAAFDDVLPSPESLPTLPPDAILDRLPETRFPSAVDSGAIRRLIAPNDETKALYLNTPGTYVARRGETLSVKLDADAIGTYRLIDIHHIALFGPVQISTSVVQGCCEHGIPITYFSMGGYFYGISRGHALPNVTARIAQFSSAADSVCAVRVARAMIHGKIRNQRTLLQRNHAAPSPAALRALKWLAATALDADALSALLGIEGSAARIYFENFSGMIRASREDDTLSQTERYAFDFRARNRRPPRDPVNAVLSLLYAILAKDCAIACHACGLDPYVGFLHQPRHGKPALALDLMEEFRPILADSATITLFNNRMVDQSCFVTAGRAVVLTPAGRKAVFTVYEKRLSDTVTHPVFGYKVSYRRALELQARLLSKVLEGEVAEYIPFTTR